MQIEENTATKIDGGDGGGVSTIESTDDENCFDFRASGRFAKRNYRKRSNSSGSTSPMRPDYDADMSASNTDTNRNAENDAAVVAENAPDDTHSSDDEHSNSVVGLYDVTTATNSSSGSISSSDTTSGDEMMSEECSSDSDVSEETVNKSNRALDRPPPK